MPSTTEVRQQPVIGLVPPQLAEAVIRVVWPSVTVSSAAAGLGKALMRSFFLAPLGWFLLAPFYFRKILPFLATRYVLTNRRIMVQRGLKGKPTREVNLNDVDEVRLPPDSLDPFYRSGNLEIIAKGQVALTLSGVPGPESFRVAIVDACKAWVPGKASALVGQFGLTSGKRS